MNVKRRLQIVAGVIVGSAAAGAAAGLFVAGLMLASRIGHVRPTLVWELFKLGSQTGAAAGLLFGPVTVLTLLRRVPLRRLMIDTFLAVSYGGSVGFAASMMFSQPRPVVQLVLTGAIGGFSVAAARLWRQFRAAPESTPMPSSLSS